MLVYRSWRIVLGLVLAALLVSASRVHAQSIVDARRVEFTPSPQHNELMATGAPVVERYTIDVFVAGAAWPVASADLGKPAPGSDGLIRVEFVSLLSAPLANGVTYEAMVEAVGPGGRSGGTRTNTFAFNAAACTPTVSPLSGSFPAVGGNGLSAVTAAAGCVWNATSNATWITITAGGSGSGSGTVGFRVAENTSIAGRAGTLTIAGATFNVTQAGATCTYSITPNAQSFAASGGTGASAVTAGTGCAWTAVSNASWISVTGGASSSGSANVTFSVAQNTATSIRSGTLTIAGTTFTVTQANASCTYGISPSSKSFGESGGTGSSTVSTGAGCPWSASTSAPWITITSGGSGSGPGTANFSVAPNTATTTRSGTLTIAGFAFTVSQAATSCSYSVSSTSQTIAGAGGTGSTVVSTLSGCPWTATSNTSWISVIAGESGTGSGTVAFSIAPNTGTSSRVGSLTVAGTTVTITQITTSVCTPSILPTSRWFTIDGGFGNSVVTNGPTCEWDAVSNVAWIAVLYPGPGKGSGTVTFIVASNSGAASRTGTLTIAGQTLTVTQSGTSCGYSVSPTSQTIAGAGGTGSSTVTTTSSCVWMANSNASWITITGGAVGSGSGGVTFSAAANPGLTPRTGTLSIAGTTFTVTQTAPGGCATSMTPTSWSYTADGGFGNANVTAASTCAWDAFSNNAWIAVINAGPGHGDGKVNFIIATNTTGASRTGTLSIAGSTLTVTQTATSGCSYTVSPESLTVGQAASTSNLAVSTQTGCSWTSSGGASWATLTGAGSGSGNATIVVVANTGTSPRSVTITVAGRAVTLTQKGKLAPPANFHIVK